MKKLFLVMVVFVFLYSSLCTTATLQRVNYVKADDASQWVLMNNGLAKNSVYYALVIDPTNTNTIYAGAAGAFNNGDIFKSTNGGASWTTIENGLTDENGLINFGIRSLVIDRTNTNVLYAGTDGGGVFKTTNRENFGLLRTLV